VLNAPIFSMITYIATNTVNGKFYIGSTNDFERRKSEHLRSKANYPFQNALRINPEVFEWELTQDESENPDLEQAFLDMWFGKEQCYNVNKKADRPPSPLGKVWSEESKKNLSEALTGRSIGAETRNKMRVSKIGELNVSSKKVEVTHPGGEVETFPSAGVASRSLNCAYGRLKDWLRRNHMVTLGKFKGFTFRYLP